MKIAVVGSVPRSLVNFRGPMIRRMVEAGAEVVGVAPGRDTGVEAALSDLGAGYASYRLERAGTNPLRDLVAVRDLQDLFRDVAPDLVLAYTMKPVIYGLYAARLAGVPRRAAMITGLGYAFEGGSVKRRAVSAVARRLARTALRGAEVAFFQNPDDQAFFERAGLLGPGTRAVRVNGTGVDLDHFAAAPVPAGPPRFLFMGRLLRAKGVPEFVEAAVRVKAEHPGARFLLLGSVDANPGSVSQAWVDGHVASGTVEHLGRAEDVRPVLAESSVFVLPTAYREGVPRSTQEALALGRPVITTDRPGCRETVVEGENGFLVPPHDAGALVDAMRAFAEDPGLAARMGAASRAHAERRYDVESINDVIVDALGLEPALAEAAL
jgi:glycosyltransferase involved in cell wall biosynthesis